MKTFKSPRMACNAWAGFGRWLKGNVHTHTTQSDGRLAPEEIGRAYGKLGYDFVFLTDHNKFTACPGAGPRPLLITAVEIGFAHRGHAYHFVCLGVKEAWDSRSFKSPLHLLERARREKVFVIQAHPYWCGTPSARCVYPGKTACPGVEVYNTVCDLTKAKGYSSVHWDELLDAGHRMLGFAVDDTHHASHIGGGWIMLKAAGCSAGAILQAIRAGRFYSTQGPEIKSVKIRGREIRVACSPAARINFVSNRYRGACFFAGKGALRGAAWSVPEDCRYVRIELADKTGKMAWSNPFYFP